VVSKLQLNIMELQTVKVINHIIGEIETTFFLFGFIFSVINLITKEPYSNYFGNKDVLL
jgi:hypothetical protein